MILTHKTITNNNPELEKILRDIENQALDYTEEDVENFNKKLERLDAIEYARRKELPNECVLDYLGGRVDFLSDVYKTISMGIAKHKSIIVSSPEDKTVHLCAYAMTIRVGLYFDAYSHDIGADFRFIDGIVFINLDNLAEKETRTCQGITRLIKNALRARAKIIITTRMTKDKFFKVLHVEELLRGGPFIDMLEEIKEIKITQKAIEQQALF